MLLELITKKHKWRHLGLSEQIYHRPPNAALLTPPTSESHGAACRTRAGAVRVCACVNGVEQGQGAPREHKQPTAAGGQPKFWEPEAKTANNAPSILVASGGGSKAALTPLIAPF